MAMATPTMAATPTAAFAMAVGMHAKSEEELLEAFSSSSPPSLEELLQARLEARIGRKQWGGAKHTEYW